MAEGKRNKQQMTKHNQLFGGSYNKKRVLVTGHTGFKGSWLCLWLKMLGADVAGFSFYLPSEPCNFEAIKLKDSMRHYEGDVRDHDHIKEVFEDFKPQIVFHLAAQSLVRKSYDDPKTTFDTNLGGTVNVLECIRKSESVKAAVMITSDKCYYNKEWEWGYRESDELGGDDPYSASKGCAEIAVKSYISSYFKSENSPKIATTRAGNVIGGGDWAKDRIVPDCVRAWSAKQEPVIRNPYATRPWQHVLEPLSGYLWLGANLLNGNPKTSGEAFNFGPEDRVIQPVGELVEVFLKYWKGGSWKHVPLQGEKKEASLLKLCCDKALQRLQWHALLNFEDTVKLTAEWYRNYYSGKVDIHEFTCAQIDVYIAKALDLNMSWTKNQIDENRNTLERMLAAQTKEKKEKVKEKVLVPVKKRRQ
jgi:CDP-glucose 4,6-dehydratase